MLINIDTRERLPLKFKNYETKVIKLDQGDYSCTLIDGHESLLVFDRKSIGDLFGTLTNTKKTKNYDRFKREIERATKKGEKLIIIIEGSLTKVERGYKHSKRKGESIIRQLNTMKLEYGVEFVFCRDRDEMVKYIEYAFESYGKLYASNNRESIKNARAKIRKSKKSLSS